MALLTDWQRIDCCGFEPAFCGAVTMAALGGHGGRDFQASGDQVPTLFQGLCLKCHVMFATSCKERAVEPHGTDEETEAQRC